MPFRLVIPRGVYCAMLAHAKSEQPNECCGLLAGTISAGVGLAVIAYPLPNALADPRRYEADTGALFQAHRDMEKRGLLMLAVYHSHPTSPAIPSRTDHEQWAHGEEVVCLIVTLVEDPPGMRGWWMTEGKHREAEWENCV
jgi:[CysO sulfur-carrier protein]-S-L-cysteine hydrolase